jgi:hypothetical protein
MRNQSPDLRFGIQVGSKRSSYWRMRAGAVKPELFLEREGTDRWFHISLHESGHWHLKVDGEVTARWERPDELVPGFTHAFAIVQPVPVAIRDDTASDEVQLVSVAPDAEPTYFDAFIERPGANINSWPGKNADGTVLVGRVPLAADVGTCCVVAHQRPLPPGKKTFPGRPTESDLAQMKESARRGTLLLTLYGEMSDGAIALIDLRAARDLWGDQGTDGADGPQLHQGRARLPPLDQRTAARHSRRGGQASEGRAPQGQGRQGQHQRPGRRRHKLRQAIWHESGTPSRAGILAGPNTAN